jgi:hypothetical protein
MEDVSHRPTTRAGISFVISGGPPNIFGAKRMIFFGNNFVIREGAFLLNMSVIFSNDFSC